MPTVVLDSYAIPALLNGEPGGRRVRELFVPAAQGKIDLVMSLTAPTLPAAVRRHQSRSRH